MTDVNQITYFAQTNFRNKKTKFGIKKNDRTKHMYIIGKTGMGKTTLLENMAIQDIRNGEGLGIVDPHGSFAEKMINFVPRERIKDVIYFNPADIDWPIGFNIMEDVGKEQRHLVANGLMSIFKKLWPDVWSARMEYILNNTILALLEYPDSTLLGVNRMLADKDYRKKVVEKVTDPIVKAFWRQEFAKYTERFAAEATPAIQNKVGQFTANPLLRNIIGQEKSSFDFRAAMDEKKIVIINLSKGKIGELNSQLIGSMLITKIYLAAMSRASDEAKDWPDFYLYVDEFQNFATESFADILSEARKYKLALILAHQYIEQMDERVREAVFGNVGTHIVFRVGAYDAEVLEKEFAPEFTAQDIVNLGFANIYLKLMIDGVASRPFSAVTLPPFEEPKETFSQEVIDFCRKTYCLAREEVERRITLWSEPVKTVSSAEKEEKEEKKSYPKLYEAECSVCGKKLVVPFRPDGKRPVFCPKHKKYIEIKHSEERGKIFSQGSLVIKAENKNSLSLKDLDKKTQFFYKNNNERKKKKEKPKPDINALRRLLKETLDSQNVKKEKSANTEGFKDSVDSDNSDNSGKEKILRPGDKISF